ncbi:helix-turn-helix transcriptional regulator [Gymnodinialimonas sp. 57CJ19]|uniref:helix-turn-helix domain-containing protein n=1 Tax=Gymnodinialimonas sp. 57CJ19 TaxID=3138498 RepID=UPI0022087749|nr:helix-turn-helix transcriptional regulator [Rhodobacteraceae bacterium M385]
MDSRRILAVNLKKFRGERSFSQEDLAHLAELDRTYISALERSRYSASLDVLDKLAAALGVKSSELLTGETSPMEPE